MAQSGVSVTPSAREIEIGALAGRAAGVRMRGILGRAEGRFGQIRIMRMAAGPNNPLDSHFANE